MFSDNVASASKIPTGCVVVLEPGARWPEMTFAAVPDRDGVVVMSESPTESLDDFLTRLNAQCAHLIASGVQFKTAIVACCCTSTAPRKAIHQKLREDFENLILAKQGSAVLFVTNTTPRAGKLPIGEASVDGA